MDKNIAYHVANDKVSVDKAREELAIKHNYDNTKLQYMEQIHSSIVRDVYQKKNPQICDAIITDKFNTPLMVMVADCIPILFYDDIKKIIAVAHAGRVGTFKNIAGNTIDKMQIDYKSDPKNIKVLIGASIQKCCYEVSQELANEAIELFGKEFTIGRFLDLQAINKKQLLDKGVKNKHIDIANICTKCTSKNYFSYRKDSSCGRFAGVIMMRDNK